MPYTGQTTGIPSIDLDEVNATMDHASAKALIEWAVDEFGDGLVMSTSFGIQSALMLSLATSVKPDIPVIWIDTGYLPAETYKFAHELIERLSLNIKIYQPKMSPAHMEAMYGKLWETDHKAYGKLRKVEPMQRAMEELGATALLTGIRGSQTAHRKNMRRVNIQRGSYKICPVLHWSDEDIKAHFTTNNLPYHPLKEQGYETVGDAHSSAPVDANGDVRSSRFGGKHQECGLHVDDGEEEAKATPITTSGVKTSSVHLNSAKIGKGIEIYSKPSCRFCVASKALLRSKKLGYTEYLVGVDVDRATLEERVGQKVASVPQIFIDGHHVGGFPELKKHLDAQSPATLQASNLQGSYVGPKPTQISANAQSVPAQSADAWMASIFKLEQIDSAAAQVRDSAPFFGVDSYVGPAPTTTAAAVHAASIFSADAWMHRIFACA